MIPFVAAGGILIALSFLSPRSRRPATAPVVVAGSTLAGVATDFDAYLGDGVGARCCSSSAPPPSRCLVPVLAGFIAFAIADRPGLAPGFVGGAIAAAARHRLPRRHRRRAPRRLPALWVTRWAVPPGLRHVLPVVVTPLVSTLSPARRCSSSSAARCGPCPPA